MRSSRLVAALVVSFAVVGLLVARAARPSSETEPRPAGPVITVEQIEADWVRQNELRETPVGEAGANVVAPEEDARGGCDGVKNGKWGFHTQNEEKPWWQVDLGEPIALGRLRVFNRCDGNVATRTRRLMVLVSDDAESWRQVCQHDGTTFLGLTDGKPMLVALGGVEARYVRLQLPIKSYFHLDEVEIFAAGGNQNVALGKSATQSSTSRWSVRHEDAVIAPTSYATEKALTRGRLLADSLSAMGVDVGSPLGELQRAALRLDKLSDDAPEPLRRELYVDSRRAVRKMALANPLLDFDTILFVKRAPGMFPHVSDQYYGWWSRPGGGVCLLKGFNTSAPRVECLTESWPDGNFLRPDLSYDGTRVLFSYCRHYPDLARTKDKVDKAALPEDSFYKIFEMNLDGSGVRQLTFGRYDDFDARYLPDGRIALLSTRKGLALQAGRASAEATLDRTCPDAYVRCGGNNLRPVSIFTLHRMDADGSNLRAISAFESFEWTPSVADDGRILYARWDYIDRFNGHFFSLWSTNTDGTAAQLVYGNYTMRPQCIFEARAIPGSQKLVFTATAHHSITGGSLCLLDRTRGSEFDRPVTRLTPEVPFPETEANVGMYYAAPYPLSEDYFLVGWSDRRLPSHRLMWDDDPGNPRNAMGLYLYDAFGNLELLYRDPEISSMYPIPVRSRPKPPARPDAVDCAGRQEGTFLLKNVYTGVAGIEQGTIKRLRIVAVPPKTQPQKNEPELGVSKEEPGKFVLGTVPVESDGSACFRVPSGLPVFFQALDDDGMAVQTMRSLTYVQPNESASCIGCHESRDAAPGIGRPPLAAVGEPSRITPGPDGTWPLRYDALVQPVLDRQCVGCHCPDSENETTAAPDLTAAKSYDSLMSYADNDLAGLAFEKDLSLAGGCVAANSKLLALLTEGDGHEGVRLDAAELDRLVTWMDLYAPRQGSFCESQEDELRRFRHRVSDLLVKP